MFNLFKKKKSSTPENLPVIARPGWVDYMTDQQYGLFISIVQDYFRQLNIDIDIDDGVVAVAENELGYSKLGLSNISQSCAKLPESEYQKQVFEHFDSMQKIYKFNKNFDQTEKEFHQVSDYISVRIMKISAIGVIGQENLISRALTDDIAAIVIYDLPDSTLNVKPEILKSWSKSAEEVFSLALENCRKNYPFQARTHDLDGVEVYVFNSDHYFHPSILLYEDEMSKYGTDYGSLVITPTRNLVMIFPIQDLQVVDAVNKLIAIAHGAYRDGPGSLTPELYWYQNGKLVNLPYSIADSITFSPPQKFLELVNFLPKKKTDEHAPSTPQILPRIKADYNHEIYKNDKGAFLGNSLPSEITIPEKFQPIIESFTADLTILFAIDTGEQYTILNHEFLEKNPHINISSLKNYAMESLVKEIGDKIQLHGDVTSSCMLTCGGNFEAALLLLDFWDQIHEEMGHEIYVALPTRDVLLAAAVREDNRIMLLEKIKHYFDKNADFLTSKALYIKTRGTKELRIVDTAF